MPLPDGNLDTVYGGQGAVLREERGGAQGVAAAWGGRGGLGYLLGNSLQKYQIFIEKQSIEISFSELQNKITLQNKIQKKIQIQIFIVKMNTKATFKSLKIQTLE